MHIPDLKRPGGGGGAVAHADTTGQTASDHHTLNWEEVVDSTVSGGAVTTIALGTGFDLDTYDYEIVGTIDNATGSTASFFVYCNNDTTAANYNYGGFYSKPSAGSGNASSNGYSTSPLTCEATASLQSSFRCFLTRMTDGKASCETSWVQVTSATTSFHRGVGWFWETTDNVTQFDFTSSVASSIANGSRVRVYRRAK